VIIVVNGGGDSSIVVVPLAVGDLAIIVFVTEVSKEFKVSFIFGNLTRDNFWVGIAGVADSQIWGSYATTAIEIEFGKSTVDDVLSAFVQLTSDCNEELIVVDCTIMVGIEMGKESISFFLGQLASTFIKTVEEFLGIKFSITINVNGIKNSTESSNSLGTSFGHLIFDLGNDYSND